MEKLFEELEKLTNTNIGAYSQNNRVILERRYQAFKFIKLGIHSDEENKKACRLVERLMHISISKNQNDKDDWLVNRLVERVMKFEKKYR